MCPVTIPVLSEEESLDRVLVQIEDSASDNLLVSLSPAGWNTITKQEVKTMVGEGKGREASACVRFFPYDGFLICTPITRSTWLCGM